MMPELFSNAIAVTLSGTVLSWSASYATRYGQTDPEALRAVVAFIAMLSVGSACLATCSNVLHTRSLTLDGLSDGQIAAHAHQMVAALVAAVVQAFFSWRAWTTFSGRQGTAYIALIAPAIVASSATAFGIACFGLLEDQSAIPQSIRAACALLPTVGSYGTALTSSFITSTLYARLHRSDIRSGPRAWLRSTIATSLSTGALASLWSIAVAYAVYVDSPSASFLIPIQPQLFALSGMFVLRSRHRLPVEAFAPVKLSPSKICMPVDRTDEELRISPLFAELSTFSFPPKTP